MDAIGILREVTDEYKNMDQIGEDLTTTLYWWLTINTNVDWINDIYDKQQRFVNETGDAVKGSLTNYPPPPSWPGKID